MATKCLALATLVLCALLGHAARIKQFNGQGENSILEVTESALRDVAPGSTSPSATKEAMSLDKLDPNWWIKAYFVSLVCSGAMMMLHSYLGRVDLDDPVEYELLPVKGRPCWNSCCVVLYVLLSIFLFWAAYITAIATNKKIETNTYRVEAKAAVHNITTEGLPKTSYDFLDPGQCAYLTGMGLICSVLVACVILVNWRKLGNVKISSSLLIQFMLRGASLSLVLALLLECGGGAILMARAGVLGATDQFSVGGVLMNLLVGFSEECAKLLAVTCGSCLTVAAFSANFKGCCCFNNRCFQLLVETPRALGLAGLASGFGFMIAENMEYMLSITMEPTGHPNGKDLTSQASTPSFIVNIIIIAARVLLSIHPWLTGLSSLRIGRIAFSNPEPTTACLGPSDFMWAVLPSVLIHAVFDFTIQTAPLLALLTVPVLWYKSRQLFTSEWSNEEGRDDPMLENRKLADTQVLENNECINARSLIQA